jgi:arylsulfatase A-like enzyme
MKLHQRFSLLLVIGFSYGGLMLQSARCADPLFVNVDSLTEVTAETPGRAGRGGSKGNAKKREQHTSGNDSHPNVLFLAIDDLNDWVGALGGHPQAQTPNLDRLMSRSVSFRNAHCAAPVCGASRHALLSGLRPSTTGWYTNASRSSKEYKRILGDTIPLPTHFKHNGYKTMAAGKIFHKGTSDVKGYDYWDETRGKYKWPRDLAARGHGYQGKGGGHFHPFPRDGGAIYQTYQEGVSGQSLCWGALEKTDIPPEGMPDEQVAAWAVERLQQKHHKPFFLAVGLVRPHVPYTAPQEFFDLYPLEDVVVPDVPMAEMDDIPLLGKAMAYGTIQGGDHQNVLGIGPDYWREMVRAYLACVSFADAQAGKVLRALDASPYANNTIIVFWSDHGQHLGEKRHWRKMALWEESTRVPLAFRLPRSVSCGQSCDQAVSLIDIYPTLLELCNLPNVKGLEGTSLLPQLKNPATRRLEPAVTTWYYKNHAVRSLNFRYIRYRDGTEELYDHRSDPNEHTNLAADPRYARIKEKLAAYMPKNDVLPTSMKDGGTDSFGKKVRKLRAEGVPAWLGKE